MFANVNPEYVFRVVDKAMAPDADDRISPKKALMMIEGLVLGLVIGVIGVLASGDPSSRTR
jgi:uncharacterized protein involved in exopolysaccharide biosynthesis